MWRILQKYDGNIFFAILSTLIIAGGLATALAEKSISRPIQIVQTETSLPTHVAQSESGSPTAQNLLLAPSDTPAPTPTASIPAPTLCPAPENWIPYIIQPGDNLNLLATRYKISASVIKRANCLVTDELLVDTRLYLPAYKTATPIPCGAPSTWTRVYIVQAGDNLYRIGLKYRISIAALQQANCLGNSTQIRSGQRLAVPNVPTSTAAATKTLTITATETAAPTQTPATPTLTPMPSATATPTSLSVTATVPATETSEASP